VTLVKSGFLPELDYSAKESNPYSVEKKITEECKGVVSSCTGDYLVPRKEESLSVSYDIYLDEHAFHYELCFDGRSGRRVFCEEGFVDLIHFLEV